MRQRGFTLLIYLVLVLAILGALYGLYALVDENWATSAGLEKGKAQVRSEWLEANRQAREAQELKSGKAAEKLEGERAEAKVIYRTITERVNVEVEKPVYRNVCLDPIGVCLANAAILGKSPDTCQPDKPVPPVKSTGERGSGIVIALDHGNGGILSGLRE